MDASIICLDDLIWVIDRNPTNKSMALVAKLACAEKHIQYPSSLFVKFFLITLLISLSYRISV